MSKNRSKSFKGNPVINRQTGEKVASFEDILLAPGSMAVTALITSKGNFLNRKIEAISAEQIHVWGSDAILTDGPSTISRLEDLPGFEEWITVADDLKGRHVISTDGKQVGVVDDFQITVSGEIAAVELGNVFLEGTVAETKEIPIEAVRSLGPDVVIVDLQQVEQMQPAEAEIDLSEPEETHFEVNEPVDQP